MGGRVEREEERGKGRCMGAGGRRENGEKEGIPREGIDGETERGRNREKGEIECRGGGGGERRGGSGRQSVGWGGGEGGEERGRESRD